MGSLFRSESMALCQLFLQNESAYSAVSNLGELGLVQFRDTNASVSAFQRRFVNQVRRCEEMERKLTYVESEIIKDEIPVQDLEQNPTAPQPKELIDLESTFEKLETELREVNSNSDALKKTYFELTELKNVLIQAHTFFADNYKPVQETHPHHQVDAMDHTNLVANEVSATPAQHGFVTGVILRERILGFEMMLWRVCRGKVFLKQAELDSAIEDPITGAKLNKVVFMLFFQGDQLKGRVKKICDGFHATLYPCPESYEERDKMLTGVKTRLEDLNQVLNQTQDHRHRLLVNAAKSIKVWLIKVRKVKAIYHTMNLFNQDVTKECLIAECWCSDKRMSEVQQALRDASEQSGSSVPSIVNRMETKESPPTYNIVNKFTSGFQNIVDAYGVATYTEVNPAPYTIITFPFIFAVMFGDCGHGLLMALFAFWMIIKEKQFLAKKGDNEIWNTMFGGRYIIFLMGLFSIYTGLIYNDAFSKSINIFGSPWKIPQMNVTKGVKSVILNPVVSFNDSSPYPFGLDPIWQSATNKIMFLNSYKMKVSIILGVSQMLFGVMLSIWNHIHFRRYINILCEFIPQLLFLLSIFGYLVILIILKWFWFDATRSSCAPSLLISLINMFLMTYPKEPCYLVSMYDAQEIVQKFLVALALVCVPWMLLIKPIFLHMGRHRYEVTPSEGQEEHGFGDLFIHQAIHTIEYCLGSISHTASYLRLWALSLAHAQLSEVLWNMVMKNAFLLNGYAGCISIYVVFAFWAALTIGILLVMEGLSAFLHALRLHWVEFQSKFYDGQGYAFVPFSFKAIVEGHSEV
ncbi:V-type proton ATPase 116 kDa subunit a 1-like isoform X1 [Argiope bruennichi]|uniref:V-type proton ATPase 116 kDa subunit a 1-like isoform X1 n=1 Tax=Argiope bruennichi TaxID=94029 RepID=UPI0024941615|nr:V-type proton ATPase 116 kDa subunit a 1-like isoform X1 [Argiope bruennichi]